MEIDQNKQSNETKIELENSLVRQNKDNSERKEEHEALKEQVNSMINFKKYDSGEFSVTMGGTGDKFTKSHGLKAVPSLVTVWGQITGTSNWVQLVCQVLSKDPSNATTNQGMISIVATTTNIKLHKHKTAQDNVMLTNKNIENIDKCRVVALAF